MLLARSSRASERVELYFDNLVAAKHLYQEKLDLKLTEEETEHHAHFDAGGPFLCVERKGVEEYPSRDKAVIFLEVPGLRTAVQELGATDIVRFEPGNSKDDFPWAVLHDLEGHNVLLVQAGHR